MVRSSRTRDSIPAGREGTRSVLKSPHAFSSPTNAVPTAAAGKTNFTTRELRTVKERLWNHLKRLGDVERASRCCCLPYAHDRKNGKETSEPDEEFVVDNEHIHAQRIPVNEKVIYKNT